MAVYVDFITWFLLLSVAVLSYAFNVHVPSAILHEGPPGSYFGFDVDQHFEEGRSWLLVGAPKANTSQPNVIEGGYVYKCREQVPDKRPGTRACEPVKLDTRGHNIQFENGTYHAEEDKSHQWLGASVASAANGVIVACAPRYVYFTTNLKRREPVGTCFYKSPTAPARDISPCRDGAPDMIPRWGYHRTGFCQAGFSISFSSNGKQIVMGAVGSHYWQGQIFVKNLTDDSSYGLQKTQEKPFEFDDTYLGYSLAVADFNGDGREEYAVSVPRGSDLKGQVTVYGRDMFPIFNVSGEQLGEYFGYSVTASDLNGDGLADLVVGAPFYAEHRGVYESGRVFVFYQNRMIPNMHQSHKSIIEGSKKSGSRFGTSVAGLGDINGDSYQDIVVGAPYDGEQNGGAIYIFHGSSSGVRQKASQIIFAKEIDPGLRTFGFSLSGGSDQDSNSYPDILVGAYSSDSAVYLKTRPIVQVSVELKVTPNIVRLEEKRCQLDGVDVVCFQVEACISFGGVGVPNNIDLTTNLTLDSNKAAGQHRAFYKGTTNTIHVATKNLQKGRVDCSIHDVYFKIVIVDKLNPIDIQLEYELVNLERMELPPILDAYIPTKIQTQAEIWKNCGPDNLCIPDLSVKAKTNSTELTVGNPEEIRLEVVVRNRGEDAYEATVILPLPSGVRYVSFSNKNEVSNVRCGTQENEGGDSVVCNIGNPFPAGKKANFYLRLDPVKVNGSEQFLDFDFVANSSNKENSTDLKNNFWKTSLSVRVVTDILMTGVSNPEQILFNISTMDAPKTFDDVGPEVKHVYKVRNLGPSKVKSTMVSIFWPSILESDLDLLYLTAIPQVTEGPGSCTVKGHVNRHKLQKGVRRQRDVDRKKRVANAVTTSPSFRQIKCKSPSDSCALIVCHLGLMAAEESATIEIISRLWIQSFKKSGLTSAFIHSLANAEVLSVPYSIRPEEYSIATFQIKTYTGDRNAGVEKKQIAWWVIALAIAAGFIVLLCLIMALYKCGFFKRGKYVQMKKGKLEKNGSPPQNGNSSRHSSPPVKQTPSKHSSPSIKYDSIPSNEY